MNEQEISIQIRDNGNLSIQGANVLNKKEEVKTVLANALKALEKEPDEEFRNELIYKP